MAKHVLFVHDNRSLGGVAAVSHQLAEALVTRGWAVDHWHLGNVAAGAARLRRLVRERGVLLATQNFSASYVAAGVAQICRRPWVMCVHGPVWKVLEFGRAGRRKRDFLAWLYRRTPTIVCSSRASLDSLLEFCPSAALRPRLAVIRNTANPAFFASPRVETATGSRDIGFVGRLSPEKQPLDLLDTLRALPAAYRLHVVGSGPLQASLAEQGRHEIAAGRLLLAGTAAVSAQTYRQWRATLLCSAYEGYPLALLESLASGVPVASTPIPPAVEMLGRHAPYMLAASAAPAALARTVEDLLAADAQAVARDIASINAEHDPGAFADEWDALLSGCLRT